MDIRLNCIWCKLSNLDTLFPQNLTAPIGSYTTNEAIIDKTIPFNVQYCPQCGNYQVKYLADPSILYEKSHAFIFNKFLYDQSVAFYSFIKKHIVVDSVLEVGAGNGVLADIILEDNKLIKYTIVDPSYIGNKENREIKSLFFELLPNESVNEKVLIMSHVFEHFYNPTDILEKIKCLESIEHFFINFPNLEKFLQIPHYNVLNLEHSFFVPNSFLHKIFSHYNFELIDTFESDNHSIFFYFKRNSLLEKKSLFKDNSENTTIVSSFFSKIQSSIEKIHSYINDNKDPLYIWPCSHQTQYLFIHGLSTNSIKAILDNYPKKWGTYLYGYNIQCLSFDEVMKNDEKAAIILNGGVYNKEILEKYQFNTNKTFIPI